MRLIKLFWFSAAKCRGLIEAATGVAFSAPSGAFSAAKCRGLIEALKTMQTVLVMSTFSAAKCRGLIEANARSIARRASPRAWFAADDDVRRVCVEQIVT